MLTNEIDNETRMYKLGGFIKKLASLAEDATDEDVYLLTLAMATVSGGFIAQYCDDDDSKEELIAMAIETLKMNAQNNREKMSQLEHAPNVKMFYPEGHLS